MPVKRRQRQSTSALQAQSRALKPQHAFRWRPQTVNGAIMRFLQPNARPAQHEFPLIGLIALSATPARFFIGPGRRSWSVPSWLGNQDGFDDEEAALDEEWGKGRRAKLCPAVATTAQGIASVFRPTVSLENACIAGESAA